MADFASQAVADLQTLLRFDTTNPPGNEGPAIAWIAERLREAGIEPTIVSSNGRPNLVARLLGDGSAGGPLLLAGHVDVVPVDRAKWTHDPFGGEIDAGYLWGRGAVDMKNMVVQCMTAFLELKRRGIPLRRDVIFAAVSDEEEGCRHGSRFLVEQHPDLVRAEYMLGEFGGFSLDVKGVRYYPIQVAEKGACQLKLTAKGDPGHGSVPHGHNAVVHLAEALHRLGTTRLPLHPCASVALFLREMAASQRAPDRWVLPLIATPAAPAILDKLVADRALAATLAANLSNTVCPTMASAGTKLNVIPSEATAFVDGRLVPGQTDQSFLAEVRAVIGDAIDIEIVNYFPGRENARVKGDPLYEAICSNVRETDPAGVPIPYMITGFTDAQYFGRLGATCYGYAPVRFPAGDGIKFNTLVHGHDERIHVEGYKWGVEAFVRLVSRFAAQ